MAIFVRTPLYERAGSMNVLVPRTGALSKAFPAILQRAGTAACFAADEFFAAKISNPHTRRAYARPVGRFLTWCEAQGIELRQVTPGLAGRFIEELPGSDPTRNLALAALRHFFDALVTRHAVALNPFASVRGRKHDVVDGKTPELTIQQARALLRSLDLSRRGAAGSGCAGGADLHRGPGGSPGAAAARGIFRTRKRSGSCGLPKREASSARFRCATIWTSGSPLSRCAS